MSFSFSRAVALLSIAALFSACTPQIDARGHVASTPIAESIKPGETSKEQVVEQLGSPSSTASFGPETWYYISAHKQRKAFLEPEVLDQDVVQIEFNTAGLVDKIQTYTLKDGKKIDMVERTTPTEGHSMGVVEQILGNVGRFGGGAGRHGPHDATSGRPY